MWPVQSHFLSAQPLPPGWRQTSWWSFVVGSHPHSMHCGRPSLQTVPGLVIRMDINQSAAVHRHHNGCLSLKANRDPKGPLIRKTSCDLHYPEVTLSNSLPPALSLFYMYLYLSLSISYNKPLFKSSLIVKAEKSETTETFF